MHKVLGNVLTHMNCARCDENWLTMLDTLRGQLTLPLKLDITPDMRIRDLLAYVDFAHNKASVTPLNL